jgi:hypothetical protein
MEISGRFNISLAEVGFAASADAGATTSRTAAAANPRADIPIKFLREIWFIRAS